MTIIYLFSIKYTVNRDKLKQLTLNVGTVLWQCKSSELIWTGSNQVGELVRVYSVMVTLFFKIYEIFMVRVEAIITWCIKLYNIFHFYVTIWSSGTYFPLPFYLIINMNKTPLKFLNVIKINSIHVVHNSRCNLRPVFVEVTLSDESGSEYKFV